MEKRDLFVGIDLGTLNSAVMASNGKKECIKSFIGQAKDFISAKVLKKSYLFGEDALKNRRSLNLYRPLQFGVIKHNNNNEIQSIQKLINHLIDLVKSYEDQSIFAVVGVPAECHKKDRETIIETLSKYVDSVMVVSEPFAVAYSLNVLNNALIIDIGAGTTDFCIMHGAIPTEEDQRTILFAGDHIDQQLDRLLKVKFPGRSFDISMIRNFKEKYSFVGNSTKKILVNVSVKGVPTPFDITDETKKACESILGPIVDTITDMIDNFEPEYQSQILNNILISGGGSQIKGIAEYLGNALKKCGVTHIAKVDDPIYAGAEGALKLAQDMPAETWSGS